MKEQTAAIVAILALAIPQFLIPIANAAGVHIFQGQSNESSISPSGTDNLTVAISDEADGAQFEHLERLMAAK
jgi:hypothetical protein